MAQARFTCAACGADMAWDPGHGQLKCTACGNLQSVEPSTGSTGESSFAEALAHQQPITPVALEVKCDGCGAVFTFEPPQVAGVCPFCAARIVMQPKAASPLVAPNALLPFKIPLDGSRNLVRSWIGSLWFAPNAMRKMAQVDALQGVYLPFWSYSAGTSTRYVGERGDHYGVGDDDQRAGPKGATAGGACAMVIGAGCGGRAISRCTGGGDPGGG